MLAAGLRNVDAPRDVMKESIEEAGRGVAHGLERFLTTLGTIATLAPLMGLFGTVVGMIEIFGAQNATGTNPAQLAHGISVALYNTGFGLAIAMPALVFYRHFRALVDSFIVEMELQAVKFVDIVHSAPSMPANSSQMNFRSGQGREDPEINLIPFIDVLLVILIFLMVTTTYSKFTALQITLPTADAEKAMERPFEINVTVDAKGNYTVNDVQVSFRNVAGLAEDLKNAAAQWPRRSV